ncbi:hypothetical protein F2P81_019047 [Scophthalmus maximus]|uniref:Protein FAM180A n=1 Tax=Scophthalmus maximus TaxID=52904 RepID=A0A6A4SHV6_SCOMX|nr:hypothetical protein F2P81_019047 [Scophthalmus maximus]
MQTTKGTYVAQLTTSTSQSTEQVIGPERTLPNFSAPLSSSRRRTVAPPDPSSMWQRINPARGTRSKHAVPRTVVGPLILPQQTLFPGARRIKRGTYSLVDPTFQRSAADVDLLFESRVIVSQILLAGMQIEGEGHAMLIPDEELASLRSVERLDVICEDVLPKRLSDVRRLAAELARRRRPLSWQDFERTVLTLVYAAQTLAGAGGRQQREAWTDAAVQLFRAVQKDLGPL